MWKKYGHIIFGVLIGALAILLLYETFIPKLPALWAALKSGKEADIEAYLKSAGTLGGVLALAFLQFVQVVSIVIPAAPIRIAGGLVYGAWRGFAACELSYVAANICVFLVARHLHSSVEKITKSGHAKQLKLIQTLKKGDPFLEVVLACMIPAVPNGIIPYAAANIDLSVREFSLAVLIGSILPTFIMTFIGRRILSGDYLISVLLFGGNLLIVYVLYRNKARLNQVAEKLRR